MSKLPVRIQHMEACKVEPVIAPVATTYKEIWEGREKDTMRVSFPLLVI